MAARTLEKMEDLRSLGAYSIELDVSNEESLVSAVSKIRARFGGVEFFVDNAGFGRYGALEDFLLNEVRYRFEVNVVGLSRLT